MILGLFRTVIAVKKVRCDSVGLEEITSGYEMVLCDTVGLAAIYITSFRPYTQHLGPMKENSKKKKFRAGSQ
jgi:hypothetical protein